jgi:hypothetical protein
MRGTITGSYQNAIFVNASNFYTVYVGPFSQLPIRITDGIIV